MIVTIVSVFYTFMSCTLEQARALDALSQHGTFTKAAEALKKRHTSIVYLLRTLEEDLGLALLDRAGYRTQLTVAGERVLLHARAMLSEERRLEEACAELRTGSEPSLRLIFDGVFPVGAILRATQVTRERFPKTELDVSMQFLRGVEEDFQSEKAHLMISILPQRNAGLRGVSLPAIVAHLVAHKDHPLAKARGTLTDDELQSQVLLSVRGSDPRLALSTQSAQHTVLLSDFHGKKEGLLAKMGYGWMPDHLIRRELASGELVPLRTKNEHTFQPRLYYRAKTSLGPAARCMFEALKGSGARSRG